MASLTDCKENAIKILEAENRINPDNKVTLELPEENNNNQLALLDLKIKINENGKANYEFY